MNKLPPELHIVNGTKGMNQGMTLPEKVKQRIPECEWMDDPDAWDRKKFYNETAEYLFEVYGIGSKQERHTLTMLTKEIDKYVKCDKVLNAKGLVVQFNDGKTLGANPYLSIQERALTKAIQLMNELGLTPRGRLQGNVETTNTSFAKLLQGPQIKR